MAKKIVKKVPVSQKKQSQDKRVANRKWDYPLNRNNYVILGVGVLVILLGYALMYFAGKGDEYAAVDGNWNSTGAIVIAPMMLVIGYCVIIPYGIYKFFGKKEENV